MDNILMLEDISKTFPGVKALDKVSFSLKKHEVLGIVGENGAGKSTLLKLISGVLPYDSGKMTLNGEEYYPHNYNEATKFGVFQVFQESALIQTISIYENLLLGYEKHFSRLGILNKKNMLNKIQTELSKFDFNLNVKLPTSQLDISSQKMMEIIRAFIIFDLVIAPHLIILFDEPTSWLEKNDVDKLFAIINKVKKKASIIFVSHRLKEIIDLCERVLVLKDGKMIYEGMVSDTTESRLQESMVGRKRGADYYKIKEQKRPSNTELLSVKNFTCHNSFSNISFSLKRGEILGIGGLLGSGKEQLGKALFGAKSVDDGIIEFRGRRIHKLKTAWLTKEKIGFVPSDRYNEGIFPYLSVCYNLTASSIPTLSKHYIINSQKEQKLSADYINLFDIKTTSQNTPISTLSGGNQQKVILARWVMAQSSLLFLVNPTQGVDVGAKEEIYQFIRNLVKESCAILLISDDLPELIYLSNRILIMKEGKIIKELAASSKQKPQEVDVIKFMS